MVTREEWIPLVPLTCLAIVNWFHDRYLFNRTPGRWWHATSVQWQVLFVLYPVWIFLNWCLSMQYHANLGFVIVTATGAQVVEHLTSTAILNDSFLQTRQQVTSSLIGLLIAYAWAINNFLTVSAAHNVCHVETHDCDCQCHAPPQDEAT